MNETEGTITRRRHFTRTPGALAVDLRLSSTAIRVWLRLDKYAGKDGRAFPSRAALAEDLGLSLATIGRALAELIDTGWITRKRSGFGNVIHTTLNDAPESSPVSRLKAPRTAHGRAAGKLTDESPGGSPVSRPKKETQSKETQPKDFTAPPADAVVPADSDEVIDAEIIDQDDTGELPLGIDVPAPATAPDPVQVLVGAYVTAVESDGGIATKAQRGAIGRNVKRLIADDEIPLPVLLVAVQRAGARRSRTVDPFLGEVQARYVGHEATRRAMFDRWAELARQDDARRAS